MRESDSETNGLLPLTSRSIAMGPFSTASNRSQDEKQCESERDGGDSPDLNVLRFDAPVLGETVPDPGKTRGILFHDARLEFPERGGR